MTFMVLSGFSFYIRVYLCSSVSKNVFSLYPLVRFVENGFYYFL